MTTNSNTKGTAVKLSVMTLAIIDIAAVVILRVALLAETICGQFSFSYLFTATHVAVSYHYGSHGSRSPPCSPRKNWEFFPLRWVGERCGKRFGFLIMPPLDPKKVQSDTSWLRSVQGRIHRTSLEHASKMPAGIQQNLHAVVVCTVLRVCALRVCEDWMGDGFQDQAHGRDRLFPPGF